MHAYGSPAYFREGIFGKIAYANSCQDPIPFVGSPLKWIYHFAKNTGVISHSNGKPILDHNWEGDFYQAAFHKNITKFNNRIGV
jgi:hypothetical protein